MKRVTGIKTHVFDVGDGYMVDIIDDVDRSIGEPLWSCYLYKDGFGIKMLMFGLPKSHTPTLREAKTIVEANLPDYRESYDLTVF